MPKYKYITIVKIKKELPSSVKVTDKCDTSQGPQMRRYMRRHKGSDVALNDDFLFLVAFALKLLEAQTSFCSWNL